MTRMTFTTSRTLEFFSEAELTKQIGHEKALWPLAILKEAIDNGLDACETLGMPPKIDVIVGDDFFSVRDNGPGIPPDTIVKSLDYTLRVSDKIHYVSPSRGQQGNALKTLWPAPFVFAGQQRSVIEVSAHGVCHTVEIGVDQIAQQPVISHVTALSKVKTGTFVSVAWPEVACYLKGLQWSDFYSASQLIEAFASVNPHAEFSFSHVGNGGLKRYPRVNADWQKWLTCWPTSPHWYRVPDLRALFAALIHYDQDGGRGRTVRQAVAMFDGLTGSRKQTEVVDAAGLARATLADLVRDNGVDAETIASLLTAMKDTARPVQPKTLGIIGKDALGSRLRTLYGTEPRSIRYKAVLGMADGLPFVLEVGLGVSSDDDEGRKVVVGLNWSPAIANPINELANLLQEKRVDRHDPVVVLVHLAYPWLTYRDRGKSSISLPQEIKEALTKCIHLVAKDHHQQKKKAARDERLSAKQLEELRKKDEPKKVSLIEAAFSVIPSAREVVAGPHKRPTHARQIMYEARGPVQKLTGGELWEDDNYFTQNLLPRFIRENPELTRDWDVVYDERGHFEEPHTGERIGIGTLAVREYVGSWRKGVTSGIATITPPKIKTAGPVNRCRFALFIEKEGFYPHLEHARIAERYDVAIMSTKGLPSTSARALVDELSCAGVTILAFRDFDKAGFLIAHTLRSDNDRYQFSRPPNVIDIGLRLADALEMGLDKKAEDVTYQSDPRPLLRHYGATEEEIEFLVAGGSGKRWFGRRIETNAMTSDQIIEFIERKLVEHGAEKVIPSDKNVEAAYRLAIQAWHINEHSKELLQAARKASGEAKIPKSLAKQVKRYLRDNPEAPWDAAIEAIVAKGSK